MIKIHGIPAFSDNYIWCIYDDASSKALVVDPGSYQDTEAFLKKHKLALENIIITHHHPDHSGGVARLKEQYRARVYASKASKLDFVDTRVDEGDHIHALGLSISCINVPGHTLDHNAYYLPPSELSPARLFCGDTLFSGGCGRLFEGSAEQMYDSLGKLAALPPETLVYCAHEYTLSNLEFAQNLMPKNIELEAYTKLCKQRRAQDLSTIPTQIKTELDINPFLRANDKELYEQLTKLYPSLEKAAYSVFAATRKAKDQY